MDYNLKTDIPDFYLENPDTNKFIEVFQEGLAILHSEISALPYSTHYNRCDEKYLDLMLIESGFYPDIPLTPLIKRKIIKNAQKYIDMRGTNKGIVAAINDLLGANIGIENILMDSFRIGFSMLGGNDFLSSTQTTLTFIVFHNQTDPEIINNITKLINYMKWAPTTFHLVYKEILS